MSLEQHQEQFWLDDTVLKQKCREQPKMRWCDNSHGLTGDEPGTTSRTNVKPSFVKMYNWMERA